MHDLIEILRTRGIQPTPQRLEVVRYVLSTAAHPTADDVLAAVRDRCPTISRATVYNTLNVLVEKGLLKTKILREGAIVFDPRTERHHHLIDTETGEIHDIPWHKLEVSGVTGVDNFEIQEYHVVIRGRKKPADTAE